MCPASLLSSSVSVGRLELITGVSVPPSGRVGRVLSGSGGGGEASCVSSGTVSTEEKGKNQKPLDLVNVHVSQSVFQSYWL